MKQLLIATALVASFAGAHAATNLVVDGSFEQQTQAAGTWSVYAALPGWTTVSGSGVEVRNQLAGNAFDGKNYIELDGYNNTGIAQRLLTGAGSFYTLAFEYSPRIGVGAASNPVEVLWNGASVATVTGDGTSLNAHAWQQYSYTVLGTGRDMLTFRAVGTNDGVGGSLDAVSVVAVPEASTWALMIGGLLAIGLLRSRRSRH